MKKIGLVLLGLAIVLSAAACQRNNNGAPDNTNAPAASPSTSPGGSPAASPTGSPAGSPAAGTVNAEAVYKQQCIACHAADLHGGVGPNLQNVGARMSADDIAAKIAAGGGGMTAFKGVLTDAEIHALGDWLAAKKG